MCHSFLSFLPQSFELHFEPPYYPAGFIFIDLSISLTCILYYCIYFIFDGY